MPDKELDRRVAFVFKAGRESRLSLAGPTEFLYGYPQLVRQGYQAEIVTDSDLHLDVMPAKIWQRISHAIYVLSGVPAWPLLRLLRRQSRELLDRYACLVVSTNTFGVCLALLSRVGLLRAKILFVAMGLVEPNTPKHIVAIYRWIFGGRVAVRTLAASDARTLSGLLRKPVAYLPFGVDSDFWTPSAATVASGYVLSLGNDSHRDYATLLRAWQPDFPQLRIITRLPISSDAANVTIERGDWHQQVFSDEDIRDVIRGARFVVLPITATVQPSGQSVCLQAMACSKAVVITDFPGLWNRELIRDGETCLFGGAPGDAAALRAVIARALGDAELVESVGRRARQVVERELNVERMAALIMADLDELLEGRPTAATGPK